ncbi:GlxA family transcriptional regulator [Streptomyces gamaensis]|uniref:GlxA family transcriptional regulator n=1 Tax=Streptomyces gamaensis TaxID=1763542 RepID=A0ABW0Z708_9ACTN
MVRRDVLVVLYEGVQSIDVTGPVEVFACAGLYRPDAYRVRTATLDGRPVRTWSGLTLVPDLALADGPSPHTLVVPGGPGTRVPGPDPGLVGWLREHAPKAGRVVSVCTGAFLLAEAGLLDGHRATTHWSQCEHLAARYPAVRVEPDPIFLREGKLATSAGVTAGIDLALDLVRDDLGRETALSVARELVVFLTRPGDQAQFSTHLHAQTAERLPLRDVQQWITEHPDEDLSVEALARRAALSPRQFGRAFRDEVGMTPGRYVELIRLEQARRLLTTTDSGIEETSRRCGYGTPEAMRRAFLRNLGVGPAEYRRRFRPPKRL